MNHPPKSMQVLDLGPYTFVFAVKLGFHVGGLTIDVGTVSDRVAFRSFATSWLPCLFPEKEDVLSPAVTDYPKAGWCPRGISLSLRTRVASLGGRDLVGCGWEERREGAVIRM